MIGPWWFRQRQAALPPVLVFHLQIFFTTVVKLAALHYQGM